MTDPARDGRGPLPELGALELADLLADGTLSSQDVVESLLDRIAVREPTVNAMIAVAADARDQARASDARRAAGVTRSRLDGIPVIIKDNIECRGLPGTAGSLALAGRPVLGDAPLITRLRAAGLVVLGAANLSEWANFRGEHSPSGWSAVGGLTHNPWRIGASAGGSSSGSGAALAAGYAPLAVGTETDGSIVCPASLCGVVGLKPTVGRVPTAGVIPIAASQDSPGPMARSVADVAALFSVLAGPAVPELLGRSISVGFAPAWLSGDPAVDALIRSAVDRMRQAGIDVREIEVDLPAAEVAEDEISVLVHEMSDDLGAYLAARPGPGPRTLGELVGFNEENAEAELPYFGQEFLVAAVASAGRADHRYGPARARNLDWAINQCLGPALAPSPTGVDVIVSLAYGPAWTTDLGGGDQFTTGLVTHASAIAGWPLLSLPVGEIDGLPVGLAMVGRANSEGTLLGLAAQVESLLGWGSRLAPG